MEEVLIKCIKLKSDLIERISGNQANARIEKELLDPYIDRIDKQIDKILDKVNSPEQ
jgi:hypothetical protein